MGVLGDRLKVAELVDFAVKGRSAVVGLASFALAAFAAAPLDFFCVDVGVAGFLKVPLLAVEGRAAVFWPCDDEVLLSKSSVPSTAASSTKVGFGKLGRSAELVGREEVPSRDRGSLKGKSRRGGILILKSSSS